MAAGTTFLTKTLDQLAVNAAAVSGFTSKVYQGRKRFSDAENFENLVKALTAQTQGYLALWFNEWNAGQQDMAETGQFAISGLLFIKLDKDTTTDANSMYDLIVNLMTALMKASDFTGWGVRPLGFKISESAEVEDEDSISEWEIELIFQSPAICGA